MPQPAAALPFITGRRGRALSEAWRGDLALVGHALGLDGQSPATQRAASDALCAVQRALRAFQSRIHSPAGTASIRVDWIRAFLGVSSESSVRNPPWRWALHPGCAHAQSVTKWPSAVRARWAFHTSAGLAAHRYVRSQLHLARELAPATDQPYDSYARRGGLQAGSLSCSNRGGFATDVTVSVLGKRHSLTSGLHRSASPWVYGVTALQDSTHA